jgi:hypothetical protein
VLRFYQTHVAPGQPPEIRAAITEDAIANAGPRARASFATMCEVAQRFAGWLDLGSSIQAALEYVFARWDGRGFPDTAGDAIPFEMRRSRRRSHRSASWPAPTTSGSMAPATTVARAAQRWT